MHIAMLPKSPRLILILSVCSIAALATGCARVLNPYEEDFKCKASADGGKCVDTPTAYKDARYPTPEAGSPDQQISTAKAEAQDSRYRTLTNLLDDPKAPLLKPPKILRVLLLPYKGEAGELFMTRYAYVEVHPADWVLTDIEEK